LLFTKEFLIDTLSRDDVRDRRDLVELDEADDEEVVDDDVGDAEGDETLTLGDKLDIEILSLQLFVLLRSTELDRFLRANLSILDPYKLV
jgi:hypothetical protein